MCAAHGRAGWAPPEASALAQCHKEEHALQLGLATPSKHEGTRAALSQAGSGAYGTSGAGTNVGGPPQGVEAMVKAQVQAEVQKGGGESKGKGKGKDGGRGRGDSSGSGSGAS